MPIPGLFWSVVLASLGAVLEYDVRVDVAIDACGAVFGAQTCMSDIMPGSFPIRLLADTVSFVGCPPTPAPTTSAPTRPPTPPPTRSHPVCTSAGYSIWYAVRSDRHNCGPQKKMYVFRRCVWLLLSRVALTIKPRTMQNS